MLADSLPSLFRRFGGRVPGVTMALVALPACSPQSLGSLDNGATRAGQAGADASAAGAARGDDATSSARDARNEALEVPDAALDSIAPSNEGGQHAVPDACCGDASPRDADEYGSDTDARAADGYGGNADADSIDDASAIPDGKARSDEDVTVRDARSEADQPHIGQPSRARVVLPFGPRLEYCDAEPCSSKPPAVVKICPAGDLNCATPFHTTIVMKVNGLPISGGRLDVNRAPGSDSTLVLESGGGLLAGGGGATTLWFYAPRIELYSHTGQESSVTAYDVPLMWSGITEINLEATAKSNADVDLVFYRFAGYDTGTGFEDVLLEGATSATGAARNISGISGVRPITVFYPSELASGDGELWDGVRVNVNYGNPAYVDSAGGIPTGLVKIALEHYTRLYSRALFDTNQTLYPTDRQCIAEGLANALTVFTGYAPASTLGPATHETPSGSFDGNCKPLASSTDVGNCYFYHVRKANLLTETFLNVMFHPRHVYMTPFCDPSADASTATGDSLVVVFTEAAGTDMAHVVDAMKLPNSGSYLEAKAALGL